MTTKVVNVFKYTGLFSLVFFSLLSCEKEIESVGVDIVNNTNFTTNKLASEVLTLNKNIEKVPANLIGRYLLGAYADAEFGKMKASIVTQLGIPVSGEEYSFGDNASIDSVIVDIPYQATKEANYDDGKPQFSLDSIIGDVETEFKLSVYELKTFLNVLDPNDPTKTAIYYSDKEFVKEATPLYSTNFKVNPDDTVAYIKRYMPDASVYDIDTVKQDNLNPTIKLPLDETIIQQIFVDNAAGAEFESFDNFIHYFRGLYIEAETLTNEASHLLSLDLSNAKMTIYYSNDIDEAEDEDLNFNGTNGEQDIRTKQQFNFAFANLKSNVYQRNYDNSHQSGEDRLYIQGTDGSMATIDLFVNENLEELQSKNWLITKANLIFYVDQNASSNIVPEQLFLYNYDESLQMIDANTEGMNAVGGTLERDADGNPYKYEFRITDYISELLKTNEPVDLVKLGLKVYNPSNFPASPIDTKVDEYSWNPKGVVLFGTDESAGDKKVTFEISYTEINN